MSSYETDHPQAAAPDADTPAMSLEDVLEELEAGGGEDMILVDADGRRMMGDGVVEMLAGVMGRTQVGASPKYITSLKSLAQDEVKAASDDACPICHTSLQILYDEEEHQLAQDFHVAENLGVVRIGECRHVFCRRDASRWLSKTNSCPLCRTACDPSIPQASPTANAPADPVNPPQPTTNRTPQSQAEMMVMLESMFGAGGPSPFGSAAGHREDDRDTYSSMYS